MHATQPERTGFRTWSTPPGPSHGSFARRAAAALIALTLGLGGSLVMAGTASAEEIVDPAPIVDVIEPTQPADPGTTDPGTTDPGTTDPGETDPGETDPGAEEPPADGVEGPAAPEGTEPDTAAPEVAEPAAIEAAKVDDDDETLKKVQFCHWKPAEKNPYELLDTSVSAFFNSGHNDHENDIVPPFEYSKKGEPMSFPGLNWDDEGQAIWENDCEVTKPTIAVTPIQCVVGGGTGGASVSLYGLTEGEDYTVGIRDKEKDPIGGVDDESFTATGSTKTIVFTGLPAPGEYWAFFEHDSEVALTATGGHGGGNGGMKPNWVKFALDECPPPTIMVDPVDCTEAGGITGGAMITLGGLTLGEEYRLSVYDDEGVPVPSFTPLEFTAVAGSKNVEVDDLAAPGTYRVVLEWMEPTHGDKPKGDLTESSVKPPPEEELHMVEVWFSLDECPEVSSELAFTGADSAALPLGLGLLTIGAALTLATRHLRRDQLFSPMF